MHTLSLGNNLSWWQDKNFSNRLSQFVLKQTCLVVLDLRLNKFTAQMTANLLKSLVKSSNAKSLEEINLWGSANFDKDICFYNLAELLTEVKCLKKCNINNPTGSRNVSVLIVYA